MDINSRILITGANGLVGSALTQHLLNMGYANIIPLTRSDCDLTNASETEAIFRFSKPQYVFHAAARVYGILGNMENKGVSFFDNVSINTNVVEASRKVGVAKITVMGTGAVYPYPPPQLPLREETIFDGRPHPSENSYAQAKRAMLAMLESYHESYGLEWAYVVSCNLYGPRDKFDTRGGHVIPSLIKKFHNCVANGEPVQIWGDGSAQRDFMYVEDVADAVHLIMQNGSGPINLGSGKVYSIREVVEALEAVTGQKKIAWDSTMPNGQEYRAYDLSKLNALGFSTKFSLHEGIQKTWNWYCENN